MTTKQKLNKTQNSFLSEGLALIDTNNPKETMPLFVKDIEEKLPGAKVIYITETGSVLHGTNGENSDSDYKGIYLPSFESVLLQNYPPVINIKTNKEDTKNGADDIDMELYSIFTFIKKAGSMESNNIEILFSMFADKIIYQTEEVELIKDKKDSFLSSNVEQFIGFAMSMAYKYSEKGDRLREVQELADFLKEKMNSLSKAKIKSLTLSDIEGLREFVENKEYIHIIEMEASNQQMGEYLQVLNSYYIMSSKIGYVYGGVTGRLNSFGKRAEKAKSADGIDRKAFAHALRAILQSKELLTTKKVIYPLTYRDRLKELKFSKTMTKLEYDNIIEEEYENLLLLKESDEVVLPKSSDSDALDQLIVDIYKKFIKG